MALTEVSGEDVLRSIELFKTLGRDEFLDRHGLRKSRYFLLEHEGVLCDAEAILSVAHLICEGKPSSLPRGEAAAALRLRTLGFEVLDVRDPSDGEIVQSALDKKVSPGAIKTRAEVSDIYGGGSQSGILPSASSPTVLIYSDPHVGEALGYVDGWVPDDEHGPLFEYTGHGRGNQTLDGDGNRAIFDHASQGRALRLFKAVGTVPNSSTMRHRYVGRFKLDIERPIEVRWRPNEKGIERRVIVFRLRPSGPHEKLVDDYIPPSPETQAILIPAETTTSSLVDPEKNKKKGGSRSAIPQTEFQRREAKLETQFRQFMKDWGRELKRFEIKIKGLASPVITDVYDPTEHVLYELKGNSERNAVRMAIGQLMDYRRHITPPNPALAVLLPEEPNEDLKALLDTLGIALVYREGAVFVGVPGLRS